MDLPVNQTTKFTPTRVHLERLRPWPSRTRTAGRASGFDSARGRAAGICSSTSQCRLRVTRTVVDVRNHGHVANLLGPVHDGAQLRYCEIHLRRKHAQVKPGHLATACARASRARRICPLTILPTSQAPGSTSEGCKTNPLFRDKFRHKFSYLCAPIFRCGGFPLRNHPILLPVGLSSKLLYVATCDW